MRYRQGISRRRMLAVTAAAGGIGAGGFGGQFGLVSGASAQAQAAKRLDQFDPTLDNIISTSEPIKELASGLGGPLVLGQRPRAEGPHASHAR